MLLRDDAKAAILANGSVRVERKFARDINAIRLIQSFGKK